MPHVPGQGSIHFWLIQALFNAQSEVVVHSGLQVGGLPKYPGKQEHTACSLITRQTLFGPQGEGLHGFVGTRTANMIFIKKYVSFYNNNLTF